MATLNGYDLLLLEFDTGMGLKQADIAQQLAMSTFIGMIGSDVLEWKAYYLPHAHVHGNSHSYMLLILGPA